MIVKRIIGLSALLLLLLNFQFKNQLHGKFNNESSSNQKASSIITVDQDSITISYIGNMGVLLNANNQQVLIDGLHKKYKPEYIYPSQSDVQKLLSGKYIKNSSIDIALVTHFHQDHFNPELLKEYLVENEASIAIGPSQVTNEIDLNSENRQLSDRIKKIPYDDKVHSIIYEGIKIRAMKCPHVNPTRHSSVQNMAYIVEISGRSILHIGDTDWDTTKAILKANNLTQKKFDAVIVPYWMLLEKSDLTEFVGLRTSGKLIATHIPPVLSEKIKRSLVANYNNAVLFTEKSEIIIL